MDIGKRMDLVVFVLIVFLACLIGYNGIYKGGLNRIAGIESQIEEEKKKNELLAIISALDRKLQGYQGRSFPSTEITPVLDIVSELAKELEIKIEKFDPLPPVYGEQFVELPAAVPFSCEYHKLGKFLSLIESNREFILIKQLTVQKATVIQSGETTVPTIGLTVSGLYLKK